MAVADGYLPPVVVQIIGDAADLLSTLAKAKAALKAFAAQETQAKLGLSWKPAQVDLEKAFGWLRAMADADEVQIPARLTMADLAANIAQAQAALKTLEKPVQIPIELADTAPLIAAAQAAITQGMSAESGSIATLAGLASGAGSEGGGGGGASILSMLGWGGGKGIGGMLGGMASFGSVLSLLGFGAEHVATSGIGIAGSLAGGALGGGLLGLGALGTMGVGMGTDMAGMGQAAGDIQAVVKAQNALNQAVADYGPASLQAGVAQNQLNFVLADFSPIARTAIVSAANMIQQFKTMFDQWTGLAEARGANIITSLGHTAEAFIPTIGTFAAQNMSIIQKALKPLQSWLTGAGGTQGLGIFQNLEKIFQSELPTAVKAATNGFEIFANIVNDAAQYTGGFLRYIDKLFARFNTPSGLAKINTLVGHMIGLFESWLHVGTQLVGLVFDLFKPAVGFGQAFAKLLGGIIGDLRTWIKLGTTQNLLHNLFSAHLEELIGGIGGLIRAMLPALEGMANGFMAVAAAGAQLAADILRPLAAIVNLVMNNSVVRDLAMWGAELVLLSRSFTSLSAVFSRVFASLSTWVASLSGSMGGMLGRFAGWFGGAAASAEELDPATTALTGSIDGLAGAVESLTGQLATLPEQLSAVGVSAEGTATQVASAGAALGAEGLALDTTAASEAATGLAGGIGSVGAMLGTAAGPIGMVAGLVATLGLNFFHLGQSGPSAAQQTAAAVASMNQTLGAIPQGTIPELITYMGKLDALLGTTARQMATLAPSSTAFQVAAGKAADLYTKILQASGAQQTLTTNTAILTKAFGVSASTIESWASAAGVKLTGALNASDVSAINAAGAASGVGTAWNQAAGATSASAATIAAQANAMAAKVTPTLAAMVAQTGLSMAQFKSTVTGDTTAAMIGLVNELNGGLPQFQAILQAIGVTIPKQKMAELEAAMSRGGKVSVNKLIAEVTRGQGGFGFAIGSLRTVANAHLGKLPPDMGNFGKGGVAALAQAFLNDHQVPANARQIVTDAVTAINTRKGDWQQVGAALGQGLAGGLLSQNGAVAAAAAAVVANALSAAKAAGGIKSPSTVAAAQIGVPLAQGVGLGLAQGTPQVTAAAQQLVQAINAAFGGNGGTGSAALDAVIQPFSQMVGDLSSALQNLSSAAQAAGGVTASGLTAIAQASTTAGQQIGQLATATQFLQGALAVMGDTSTVAGQLQNLNNALSPLSSVFQSLSQAASSAGAVTGQSVGGIVTAMQTLASSAPQIQAAFAALVKAIAGLGSTAGLAGTLTGLQGVLSPLSQSFSDISQAASDAGSITSKGIGQIISGANHLVEMAPQLEQTFQTIVNGFTSTSSAGKAGSSLSAVGTTLGALSTVFSDFGTAATDAAQVTPGAMAQINRAVALVVGAFDALPTDVANQAPAAYTAVLTLATGMVAALRSTLPEFAAAGAQMVGAMVAGIESAGGALPGVARGIAMPATLGASGAGVGGAGGTMVVTNAPNITVTVPGGSNPGAIAQQVKIAVEQANADLLARLRSGIH